MALENIANMLLGETKLAEEEFIDDIEKEAQESYIETIASGSGTPQPLATNPAVQERTKGSISLEEHHRKLNAMRSMANMYGVKDDNKEKEHQDVIQRVDRERLESKRTIEMYDKIVVQLVEVLQPLIAIYNEEYQLESSEKIIFSTGGSSIRVGDVVAAYNLVEQLTLHTVPTSNPIGTTLHSMSVERED